MPAYNISSLYLEKYCHTAIFLGCGESINDINSDQWAIIQKFDTFTTNNWHYHPFVPCYYMVEVKARDRELWKQVQDKREGEYKHVRWIMNRGKNLAGLIDKDATVYFYDMNKLTDARVECPDYKLNTSITTNTLTCACGISMTMLFELWWKMGYQRIVLLGTDLYNSRYFWTDRTEYGPTHCHHNKDFEGKDEKTPHNAAHVKSFIVDFNKKWMRPKGREIVIGYTKTLLYPEIRHLPIESLADLQSL